MIAGKHIALILLLLCIVYATVNAVENPHLQKEFYSLWLPGLGGGICYFFDKQYIFGGGIMRYVIVSGVSTNRPALTFADRGRWEVYLNVAFFSALSTPEEEINLLFFYSVGFNSSFETPATLKRHFLIPYIGLELGGICIKKRGNGFMACPVLGINLVSLPTLSISIETGILLNTIAFEEFLGLRSLLNINFVF